MDTHPTMDSGGPPPSYESVMGMQYTSFEPKLIQQQQVPNSRESSLQQHHQQHQLNTRPRGNDYTPVTDRTSSPSKLSEPTVVMLKIMGVMIILVIFSSFIIYHMQAYHEQSKPSDEKSSIKNEAVRRESSHLPGSDGPLIINAGHHTIPASVLFPGHSGVYVNPHDPYRIILQTLKNPSTVKKPYDNSGEENEDSASNKNDQILFDHFILKKNVSDLLDHLEKFEESKRKNYLSENLR